LAAALLTGCGSGQTYPASTVFTPRGLLAEFTENSVKVAISLESDPQGQSVIRATFTPTDSGFHLYSKDMSEDGIDGMGQPTRLDVVSGALTPIGPVFADVRPYRVRLRGVKFPIYPEGPVTLRQPVRIASRAGESTAEIELSYMACETGGECRPPVHRKKTEIKIPQG
jgi:hypothetical protein